MLIPIVTASEFVCVRNGCRNDALMSLSPLTSHTWLTSAPYVQGPACLSATPVGPAPLVLAKLIICRGRQLDYRSHPHIQPFAVGFFGEKKKLCRILPIPVSESPGITSSFERIGTIVREITFHSAFSSKGMTG